MKKSKNLFMSRKIIAFFTALSFISWAVSSLMVIIYPTPFWILGWVLSIIFALFPGVIMVIKWSFEDEN